MDEALRGDGIGYKYGTSLAMNGDGTSVVIGSPRYTTSSGVVTGGAKVLQWTYEWSLKGSVLEGRSEDDECGVSVAIDKLGTTVAIGAPGVSLSKASSYSGDAAYRGYVDVYQWEMIEWEVYDWKLTAHLMGAHAELEYFGSSVSLSTLGYTVAVGAPEVAVSGMTRVGEVSVYTRSPVGNLWLQYGETLCGRRANGYFGSSVVVTGDGSAVVVGSPGPLDDSMTSGTVSMYTVITPHSSTSTLDANDILAITNLSLLVVLCLFTVYVFQYSKKSTRRSQILYETSEAIEMNNRRENVNMTY
jgi:hypothetical protein